MSTILSPPELWDILADFPAAHSGEALVYLLHQVQAMVGAQHAFLAVNVRLGGAELAAHDLCRGWRVRDIVFADPTPEKREATRHFLLHGQKLDPVHLGQTTINLMQAGGTYRSARLHNGLLLDWDTFVQTKHYEIYYRRWEVQDRIWTYCPVNKDVEVCFCFDHLGPGPEKRFTLQDEARASQTVRGLRWFHRRVLLSHNIAVGRQPCTRAERAALDLLLTGRSEKEIAEELRLSVGTAHNRVGAVFKKFGVRSRAELMALWL